MNQSKPILGIDLGTTHCVTAYVGHGGHITCLPDRDGDVLTPSCVMLADDGSVVVGREARAALARCPGRVTEGFKRQMGRTDWSWSIGKRSFTAPQVSAILLKRLVEDACRIVGEIGGVVITVPAYFGDSERTATLEAARIAGLDVLTLINEPTAAALASAFDAYIAAGGDGNDLSKAVVASTAPAINVVCDLGGGTFDVTVIRISGSDFDILASGGQRIGGTDFDERIMDAMSKHLFDKNAPDPHHDMVAQAKMRLAAEKAKHVLSVSGEVEVEAPYDGVEPMVFTRHEFEKLSAGLIERAKEQIQATMLEADITWHHVEELMLVGGASRMPMFREMASSISGLTPSTRLQPDLVIAQGAAVCGAIVQVQAESSLKNQQQFVSPGRDSSETLDDTALEEAVSLIEEASHPAEDVPTAPYDAGFATAAEAIRVRDVTSQSLGIIVRSPKKNCKVNAVLIRRNTRLPAKKARIFATRQDNQRRVSIPIVEGDSRDPKHCIEIGRCVIESLPPNLPKGSPVKVTFSYDASGRVSVRAEELSTSTVADTILSRYSASPQSELDELAQAVAKLSVR